MMYFIDYLVMYFKFRLIHTNCPMKTFILNVPHVFYAHVDIAINNVNPWFMYAEFSVDIYSSYVTMG